MEGLGGRLIVGAADATLQEGLDLLSGDWKHVGERLLGGDYSLWVGSAVSRARYPDLRDLLRRLLITLYEKKTDPRFEACLREILALAHQSGRDLSRPPVEWPDLESEILPRLVDNYSKVLGLTIAGEAEDFIAWELLRLPEVYDDPEVEPDADHRLMALLMAEGMVREIVTTNWDPLIEDAFEDSLGSDGRGGALTVVASGSGAHSMKKPLVCKIHGCARHLRTLPDEYRRWFVATNRQILAWIDSPEWEPLREHLRGSIRDARSLFIGLSGQDTNFQLTYRKAVRPFAGESSFDRRRVVFSKPLPLDFPQKEILGALNQGAEGPGVQRQLELPVIDS